MPTHPALQVDKLHVTLSSQTLLQDVSFTVQPGTLLWLTGANGAGKSTLLRALVGLLPHKGNVLVSGVSPTTLTGRKCCVFVPDEPALYDDLTLREHAQFTARAYQDEQAESRTIDFLQRFRLTHHLDEFPTLHSKGMRQKLSLSLALGLSAPLLLLDEPFNGLDAEAQQVLRLALINRAEHGGAVVLSAHQAEIGEALTQHASRARVAVLREGTFVERGLPL
ncbi:ABC-type multidrug transport system, ATPase component (plasmid) [Deinococcus peraridilitoris DSM 19664]|uniref:ABC-type multidrug transport system, ATPase component n=2 Tax=Deinococcus TaxID=1298 RepID=L0A8B7_DEIPD|nr:ABC transporter ATP-binding protein [Deinococcus peraridilitoris]AFZ69659.1 ABC-type multidrug transport system, ATPase component [Deinococcus peraridilitoris DSM 19664]